MFGNFPMHSPKHCQRRLHASNERGHLLLARAFADALQESSGIAIPLPDPPAGRLLSRGTFLHLRWIARNAMPEALRFVQRLATRRF